MKTGIKVDLIHLGQDYQGKREWLANCCHEIGMPCNLLLVSDSGTERRHKHDHRLMTLNTQNMSVLYVA